MSTDGDIDYRTLTLSQLQEARDNIDAKAFPLNFERLNLELKARADRSHPEPPSDDFGLDSRTISSSATLIFKAVLPAFWIPLFAAGIPSGWVGSSSFGTLLPPAIARWVYLVIWISGSIFILWGCAGLKRVRIEGDSLVVSNFLSTVVIPFTSIRDVTDNPSINFRPVTVHFRCNTRFGESIRFMPEAATVPTDRPLPIVVELRRRAGLSGV